MSAQDPLSDAREALREIHDLLAWPNGEGPWRSKAREVSDRIWIRSTEALARLDALPAPVRCVDSTELGGTPAGWHYPDPTEAAS